MSKNEATLIVRIKEIGADALQKVGELLGSLADTAKWVGASLVGFGALALKNYREQELALNELNQAMINQGMYSKDLSQKYQAQASALQKLSTFGDEQILSAQGILQTYIGQREVTKELTMATMNLASAKKMDLASAAEMVAKSIGGSTNALARQGIELKDNMQTSEKYASVVEQLNAKFGGQAEAAASGLGAIKQLQNTFSDVLETVGEKLSPVITAGAKALGSWIQKLGESKQFVQGLDQVVTYLTKGFFILKNGVTATAGVIGTGLAAAVESVTLLTQGQFTRAKEVAALGMTEMGQIIKDSKTTLDEELAMMDTEKALAEEQKQLQEQMMLAQSEANKTKVVQAEALKRNEVNAKAAAKDKEIQEKNQKELEASRAGFLSHMAALQSSSNSTLIAIGKAAAIAQVLIATSKAAADGFAWGMAMGGPPLAVAFKALAYASGAAQIAQISGVKLAEGGIVPATPGGVPAIIGEGGRSEAIIPLDQDGGMPGMGGITININGPFMGDETQARMLAKMIDEQLLSLRRSNESVAFEGVL